MRKFYVITHSQPEYDWNDNRIDKGLLLHLATVKADTKRKAMNRVKKDFPGLKFGGMFGAFVLTENDWNDMPVRKRHQLYINI